MTTAEAIRAIAQDLEERGLKTQSLQLTAHAERVDADYKRLQEVLALARTVTDGIDRIALPLAKLENECEARPVLPVDGTP